MKIAVCIKQVVTREWQVRVNDDKTWVRDQDASWELNEPDAYALEEALRLKEKHGGEVIVLSAGPARVSQVIREALARQACNPVRWVEVVRALASAGASDIVECGPGKVLAGLTRRIDAALKGHAIVDPQSLAQTLEALK